MVQITLIAFILEITAKSLHNHYALCHFTNDSCCNLITGIPATCNSFRLIIICLETYSLHEKTKILCPTPLLNNFGYLLLVQLVSKTSIHDPECKHHIIMIYWLSKQCIPHHVKIVSNFRDARPFLIKVHPFTLKLIME